MGAAVRVVSQSGLWTVDRLVDLVGVLLTVLALTVVGRRLGDAGGEWVRLATPFLVIMASLGAAAVLSGAVMKDLAQSWEHADGVAQQAYLAAFDGMSRATEDLFFGAFLALGLYLALLAPAIVRGRAFARWTGWACGISAVLVLGGNLLLIAYDPAFLAVLAGYALYLFVVAALGVSMWRQATPSGDTVAISPRTVAERS